MAGRHLRSARRPWSRGKALSSDLELLLGMDSMGSSLLCTRCFISSLLKRGSVTEAGMGCGDMWLPECLVLVTTSGPLYEEQPCSALRAAYQLDETEARVCGGSGSARTQAEKTGTHLRVLGTRDCGCQH